MVLLNRGRLQLRQLCGAKQNCRINTNRPLNACGESSTMAMGLDECRSLSASVGKTTKYLIPERPQNSTSMASSWHHPMIWYCRNGWRLPVCPFSRFWHDGLITASTSHGKLRPEAHDNLSCASGRSLPWVRVSSPCRYPVFLVH